MLSGRQLNSAECPEIDSYKTTPQKKAYEARFGRPYVDHVVIRNQFIHGVTELKEADELELIMNAVQEKLSDLKVWARRKLLQKSRKKQ